MDRLRRNSNRVANKYFDAEIYPKLRRINARPRFYDSKGVCWKNRERTGLHEYPDVDFPKDEAAVLQQKIKLANQLEPDELKDLLDAMPDNKERGSSIQPLVIIL